MQHTHNSIANVIPIDCMCDTQFTSPQDWSYTILWQPFSEFNPTGLRISYFRVRYVVFRTASLDMISWLADAVTAMNEHLIGLEWLREKHCEC